MIVLSLFDGISCGQEALKKVGINVEKYYASEINETAINITKLNWPSTIHLGDIKNWKSWNIEKPDLILGGFCCQSFSIGGKKKGFNDERGKLFFELNNIINHYAPKHFLVENVKMKKNHEQVINKCLKTMPVLYDSALVSAQRRLRLYWFNWENPIIKDNNILLKDIVHESLNEKFNLERYIVNMNDSLQILSNEDKGKLAYFRKDSQANRIYGLNNKSVTLCGNAGGGAGKMGQYLFGNWNKGYIRKITPIECERLQNLPDNYTKYGLKNGSIYSVTDTQRYKTLGNGWTTDIIVNILNYIANN